MRPRRWRRQRTQRCSRRWPNSAIRRRCMRRVVRHAGASRPRAPSSAMLSMRGLRASSSRAAAPRPAGGPAPPRGRAGGGKALPRESPTPPQPRGGRRARPSRRALAQPSRLLRRQAPQPSRPPGRPAPPPWRLLRRSGQHPPHPLRLLRRQATAAHARHRPPHPLRLLRRQATGSLNLS
jgi:hypothetical protein